MCVFTSAHFVCWSCPSVYSDVPIITEPKTILGTHFPQEYNLWGDWPSTLTETGPCPIKLVNGQGWLNWAHGDNEIRGIIGRRGPQEQTGDLRKTHLLSSLISSSIHPSLSLFIPLSVTFFPFTCHIRFFSMSLYIVKVRHVRAAISSSSNFKHTVCHCWIKGSFNENNNNRCNIYDMDHGSCCPYCTNNSKQ